MTTKDNQHAEGEVVTGDVVNAEVAKIMAQFPNVRVSDPDKVKDRMRKQMLSTSSLDEMFDVLEGSNSKGLVGKAFTFTGVEWDVYEATRGPVPMAVCQVVDPATGEADEFVTTGGALVDFLLQAQLLEVYPFTARIVEKVTRSGQKALNFERA